jgi:hypothetical protein
VPKIANADEFQQSFAIAQLAVRLCELRRMTSKIPLEKENLDPKKFLEQAWELIQSARERVLRPQTNAEYLIAHDGSHDAAENVVERVLSASPVPFGKLCDPKGNKATEIIKLHDAETGKIIEVEWKIYRGEGGERAFDNLFSAYWQDCGDKWKDGNREIGTVTEQTPKGKTRKINFYSKAERAQMAKLAQDEDAWKKRGQSVMDSWKRYGVPATDFLALADFRKARYAKRAANLEKNAKRKRRQQVGNTRV